VLSDGKRYSVDPIRYSKTAKGRLQYADSYDDDDDDDDDDNNNNSSNNLLRKLLKSLGPGRILWINYPSYGI
jgi:hypothetical protein